jgi:hypothetical protein
MNGHLIEQNELMPIETRGFAATGVFTRKQTAIANNQAIILADTRDKYPYPPANCDAAMAAAANIGSEIDSMNEKVASGIVKKDEATYTLNALHEVLNDFKVYITSKKCIENAANADQQTFSDQVQAALNQEGQTLNSKTKTNNLLIFGSLAVLAIGAVVLILRN